MTARREIYDRLAGFYRYPGEEYAADVEQYRTELKAGYAEAEISMAAFSEWVSGRTMAEIEEDFARTFDLNPSCCAEIGWHLFGERYDRGSFLVWLRSRLRETGVEETSELPDHLVHVLPLLSRLEGEEAERLAHQALQPAIRKMMACVGKDNSFRFLIEATDRMIATDFGPAESGSGEEQTAVPMEGQPAEIRGGGR